MRFFKQLFCRHEGKLRHIRDVWGDEKLTMPRDTRSIWVCPDCGKVLYRRYRSRDVIYVPETGTGDISDGSHTFKELYDHRAKLFSVICADHKDRAWKSRLHDDGTMFKGMFIVGIDTPIGQASYHYFVDRHWDLFDVKELERAPEFDGYTPAESIARICSLGGLKEDIHD